MSRPLAALLTVISFLLGTAFGALAIPRLQSAGGCSVASWWEQASPLVTQFLDQVETAKQTARVSLSPMVLNMRATQRDFEAIPFTECSSIIREDLSQGMDATATAFNDFIGNATPTAAFTTAIQEFRAAAQALTSAGVNADSRLSAAFG